VLRGGPADKAGIKPGDVLTEVEGKPVADPTAMLNLIAALAPGSSAKMKLKRQGQDVDATINVGLRSRARDLASLVRRADADLRVAEMDLSQLLSKEPADMTAVDAKIREIEKRRADLRVARVRAIESGRAVLSADQREKLRTLLAEQQPAMRAFPTSPPPPAGPSRL